MNQVKATFFRRTRTIQAIEWGEALSYRSYGIIPHLPKHSVVQRSYSDGQCSDCHEQQTKRRLFTSVLRLPKFYHKEAAMKEKVMELLRIFDLENKSQTLAKIFLTVNNDVLRSFGHWLLNQRSFS